MFFLVCILYLKNIRYHFLNQFCDVLGASTHPNNMKISGDHLSALE